MRIEREVLFGALTAFREVTVVQQGIAGSYEDITTEKAVKVQAGTVFLNAHEALPEDAPACCFLHIGPEPPQIPIRQCDDLIWLNEKTDIPQILGKLLKTILEIQQWYHTMRLAVANGTSLQEIVQMGYKMLRLPFIVWDGGFRVLGYSIEAQSRYSHYQETVQKGYTSAAVMTELKRSDTFTEVNRSGHGLLKRAVGHKGYRNIHRKLGEGDMVLGYCCVFCEDKEIRTGYMEMCELFFSAVEKILHRERASSQMSNYMYESFFIELMNDANIPEARIRERLQHMAGIPFQADFFLAKVCIRNPQVFPVRYIFHEIASLLTRSKMIIYKEAIYILIIFEEEYGDRDRYFNRSINDLRRVTEPYDVRIGVSNSFAKLSKMHYAYVQCNRAVELGITLSPKHDFFLYRNLYLYHFFECAAGEVELTSICSTKLFALQKLGENHSLDYFRILQTYLMNERSPTKTAAQLNLHRNTVIYHIRKIEAFLHTDFDDYETRLNYLLSFAVLDWEQKKSTARPQ